MPSLSHFISWGIYRNKHILCWQKILVQSWQHLPLCSRYSSMYRLTGPQCLRYWGEKSHLNQMKRAFVLWAKSQINLEDPKEIVSTCSMGPKRDSSKFSVFLLKVCFLLSTLWLTHKKCSRNIGWMKGNEQTILPEWSHMQTTQKKNEY